MRLSSTSSAKPSVAKPGEVRLSAFEEKLRRAPSQKELAGIFKITTRHLRRWEMAEEAASRPCSRPYSHADLWRLYQRRGRKGWDRIFAAQLGLADVFERFDRMRDGGHEARMRDPRSEMAAMMLRSLVSDDAQGAGGDEVTSRIFSAGLASAAKAQLRAILDCDHAREVLVKAFFEAALVAEAQPGLIRGDVLESAESAMSA
jgi:hypothetical protein